MFKDSLKIRFNKVTSKLFFIYYIKTVKYIERMHMFAAVLYSILLALLPVAATWHGRKALP